MYNNIGKKIKGFAMAIAIILTVIYVIVGIAMISSSQQSEIASGGIVGGVLIMLLGPVIAWISSWFLYGYGELVDKTAAIKKNTDYLEKLLEAHIKSQNTTSEN